MTSDTTNMFECVGEKRKTPCITLYVFFFNAFYVNPFQSQSKKIYILFISQFAVLFLVIVISCFIMLQCYICFITLYHTFRFLYQLQIISHSCNFNSDSVTLFFHNLTLYLTVVMLYLTILFSISHNLILYLTVAILFLLL